MQKEAAPGVGLIPPEPGYRADWLGGGGEPAREFGGTWGGKLAP